MNQLIRNGIVQIRLPDAVFETTVLNPSAVNLICGKNGTGKTAFASALRNTDTLTFADGTSAGNYELLHFDRRFAETQIRQYTALPGIISVSRESAEFLAHRSRLHKQLQNAESRIEKCRADIAALSAEEAGQKGAFSEACWKRSAVLRERFSGALRGKASPQRFAKALLFTVPRFRDFSELTAEYKRAFETETQRYPLFQFIPEPDAPDCLPGLALLSEPVVSSTDSQFAQFINRLHAADWVRQGHLHYSKAAGGFCPYCRQKLPADFSAQLAACFENTYQDAVQKLQQLYEQYRQAANAIYIPLRNNLKHCMPGYDYGYYIRCMKSLRQLLRSNLEQISRKLENPSLCVETAPVSAETDELNRIIRRINTAVSRNNQIITAHKTLQRQSAENIMEYIAFELRDEIALYQSQQSVLSLQRTAAEEVLAAEEERHALLSQNLRSCILAAGDPDAAVSTMNRLLEKAGFRDLRLAQQEDSPLTYQVLRGSGNAVSMLSEGEQYFLAFLYYYHLLSAEPGNNKKRIAVIDDPYTGLDAEAADTVCRLLRTLLRNCGSESSPLTQLFVLTCRTQYHQAMTDAAVQEAVPFSEFCLRKQQERTIICRP